MTTASRLKGLREMFERELLSSVVSGDIDCGEAQLIAQRALEAVAIASGRTPRQVIAEFAAAAPADTDWRRLWEPTWRWRATTAGITEPISTV